MTASTQRTGLRSEKRGSGGAKTEYARPTGNRFQQQPKSVEVSHGDIDDTPDQRETVARVLTTARHSTIAETRG